VEPDRAALREITLDFYFLRSDGLLARHADAAGSGAVPGHVAVLLWEVACEDLLADVA
jgi:hypothetical protein